MVVQVETKKGAYDCLVGSLMYEERGAGFPGLSSLERTPSEATVPALFNAVGFPKVYTRKSAAYRENRQCTS